MPQVEDHPMPKPDPVDEAKIADAVERTKRRRRLNSKEGTKTTRAPKRHSRARSRVKPAVRKTKQQACLDLLSRREGATIEELQAATGWQEHSVRGFLAGAVRKKLGLTVFSEKRDEGPRRYRISNSV